MKKLLSFLLIVLTLACTLTIVSCDYEIPDNLQSTNQDAFVFKEVIGGLCVTGLKDTCTDSEIIIPSYVKNGNKSKKVVEIAAYAFSGKEHVTKIAIPGTVKEIGNLAFENCTNLREVYIEKGVETFGAKLFWGSSVEKIYFSGTAKEFQNIKEKFEGIKELLGLEDFYDVWYNTGLYDGSRLFYVYCSDAMITYKYPNGVESVTTYDKASKGLDYTLYYDGNSYSVSGIGTCKDTNLIIPSMFNGKPVTSIGDYAFQNCKSLTSVVIPDSITFIGGDAFNGCSRLTSIEIPDSVVFIGSYAFLGCSSLNNITVDSNNSYVKSVDGNLYSKDGTQLVQYAIGKKSTSFKIPSTVKHICFQAFYNCSSLTNVVIPDSVTSIGEQAFWGCSNLTTVEIGKNVTSIDYDAFARCYNLKRVYIKDLSNWCNISFSNILSSPFYFAQELYLNGKLVTELVIPNGVTSIGDDVFFSCDSITSVTIPSSVTSIGRGAFSNCYNLTNVVIGNSVTSIGYQAFHCCDSLISVVIPKSVISIDEWAFYDCSNISMVYYSGTAEDWSRIYIAGNNYCLSEESRYYYSEKKPTTSGNFWHWVNGKPVAW
jgi:hypothetical protein